MEDKKAYLPYFLEESIYVVDKGLKVAEPTAVYQEQASIINDPLTEQKEKVELKPILTFGENLKHCIVLFSSEQKISADSKDLLFKILGAINRTPKDALMANVHGCSDEQMQALLAEHNHKHLISFGVTNTKALSDVKLYEPKEEKGKHYILSDDLEAVATNLDKKKALWKALKLVFH